MFQSPNSNLNGDPTAAFLGNSEIEDTLPIDPTTDGMNNGGDLVDGRVIRSGESQDELQDGSLENKWFLDLNTQPAQPAWNHNNHMSSHIPGSSPGGPGHNSVSAAGTGEPLSPYFIPTSFSVGAGVHAFADGMPASSSSPYDAFSPLEFPTHPAYLSPQQVGYQFFPPNISPDYASWGQNFKYSPLSGPDMLDTAFANMSMFNPAGGALMEYPGYPYAGPGTSPNNKSKSYASIAGQSNSSNRSYHKYKGNKYNQTQASNNYSMGNPYGHGMNKSYNRAGPPLDIGTWDVKDDVSTANKVMTRSGKIVCSPSEKENEVLRQLKQANEYNPVDFNFTPHFAKFFVIKSYSEDDIHRAIKYNTWCSTERGNRKLNSAYNEMVNKGPWPIYLMFSVNSSGHFCGVAEMKSNVDMDRQQTFWAQSKWKGSFDVKWVFVKDVPNNQFRHIRLENNEDKPVTNSRDTQEVPFEKGKMMLKIFHAFEHQTSLFDDFSHYEAREQESETNAVSGLHGLNQNQNYSGGIASGVMNNYANYPPMSYSHQRPQTQQSRLQAALDHTLNNSGANNSLSSNSIVTNNNLNTSLASKDSSNSELLASINDPQNAFSHVQPQAQSQTNGPMTDETNSIHVPASEGLTCDVTNPVAVPMGTTSLIS